MWSSDLSGSNTNDGDGCSSLCAIESNYIWSGGPTSSSDSCFDVQLDYRQMLLKHRVLQLVETANERVLELAMTEIRQVETDVVQAVLLTETTKLDITKKAVGMVKELSTTRTETWCMKEDGRMVINMDWEQCTSMETSI